MPDRLKATTRAAPFAQLAVDAHAGSDKERHSGGEAGEQNDDSEALARVFTELVGDEKARAHTDSHLGGCGHGSRGKISGESVEKI